MPFTAANEISKRTKMAPTSRGRDWSPRIAVVLVLLTGIDRLTIADDLMSLAHMSLQHRQQQQQTTSGGEKVNRSAATTDVQVEDEESQSNVHVVVQGGPGGAPHVSIGVTIGEWW